MGDAILSESTMQDVTNYFKLTLPPGGPASLVFPIPDLRPRTAATLQPSEISISRLTP